MLENPQVRNVNIIELEYIINKQFLWTPTPKQIYDK